MNRIASLFCFVVASLAFGCSNEQIEFLVSDQEFLHACETEATEPQFVGLLTVSVKGPGAPNLDDYVIEVTRLPDGLSVYAFEGVIPPDLSSPVGTRLFPETKRVDRDGELVLVIYRTSCVEGDLTIDFQATFDFDLPLITDRQAFSVIVRPLSDDAPPSDDPPDDPLPPPSGLDQIVFASDRTGDWEIYTAEIDRADPDASGAVNVSQMPAFRDIDPVWNEDKTRIAFLSNEHAGTALTYDLFIMNADGSDRERITFFADDGGTVRDPEWRGGRIAIIAGFTTPNLWTVDLSTDPPTRRATVPVPGERASPSWSPDGSGIVFLSNGALYVYDLVADDPQLRHDGAGFVWSHVHWSMAPPNRMVLGPSLDFFDPVGPIYTALGDATDIQEITTGWTPVWSEDAVDVLYVAPPVAGPAGDRCLFIVDAAGADDPREVRGLEGNNEDPDW